MRLFVVRSCELVGFGNGLGVKLSPARNSGLVRKYERQSKVSPCLKCLAGLKFGNITFCAAYVVLLSGEIMKNPGSALKDAGKTRRLFSAIRVTAGSTPNASI